MLCTSQPRRLLRRGQRRLGTPRLHPGGAAGGPVRRPRPPRRPRAHRSARPPELFEGVETVGFENRYRAKDGSWHWLRWSSQPRPRRVSCSTRRATDVTELKRIEAEREKLLVEVEELARSDSAHRPAEPAGPRRTAAPRDGPGAARPSRTLCLAILDIDHFKTYNDTHGHLAGDEHAARAARCAWDSELRGEDTIVRFGGEEFLVVLPDTAPEQAAEIVERLRAATPMGPDLLGRPRRLGLRGEHRRPGRRADKRPLPGEGRRPRPAGAARPLAVPSHDARMGATSTTAPCASAPRAATPS